MKRFKRTRAARTLAGALALLLILGLALLVDCFSGDPVSRAFANRRMLAWANGQWPGHDFYIAEEFGGAAFTYDVRLQSSVSADTWFNVGSVLGLWRYTTDYEFQVEQGYNTCARLEQALASAAASCLEQAAFSATYQPQVYVSLRAPGGQSALPQGMELDMPYDPVLAQQAALSLQLATRGPPHTAQARAAAQDAKAALEAAGLSFARYEITLRDKTVEYQHALETLVEASFTAQELG